MASTNEVDMSEAAMMETVFKTIYVSCDIENTNQVPVSKLVEFVKPYLETDLSALESLTYDLDPENKNIFVSWETFFEVMNVWANKFVGSTEDEDFFNETPSNLGEINEKDLPFVQSTPRASFGQKLLSCESLLSLSNLPCDFSMKDENTVGSEKQTEEIKRLEHQLNKVLSEMEMVKSQLAQTEEQNENLQSDLSRCRVRLTNEQHVIDCLQKDKAHIEELREEVNLSKKQVSDLTKKLHQYEKDNAYMSSFVQQLEEENSKLTSLCEEVTKREQNMKLEIFDIKAELELKDQEMFMVMKLSDELKSKLSHEKNVIQELADENELLDHKKSELERQLSSKRYSSPCPFQSSFSRRSIASQGTTTIPLYSSSPVASETSLFSYNSPTFLEKVNSPLTPLKDSPILPFKKTQNLLRTVLNCSLPITKNKSVELLINSKKFSSSLKDLDKPEHNSPVLSNVQDHSYDEEYMFESQLEELKTSPRVSLHSELFQVQQFQSGHKSVEEHNDEIHYQEIIESLKTENESLKSRLDQLDGDNEKIALQRDKEKEAQTEDENIKDNGSIELKDRLEKLEYDYSDLQVSYEKKDKELSEHKNKFNFEVPYKNLQIELNERNKQLEELEQSCKRYQDIIKKLSNTNQDLEVSLKSVKVKMTETIKKSKPETGSNRQIKTEDKENESISNKLHANEVNQLKMDLERRTSEILHLKDLLKNESATKNILWNDMNDLKSAVENLSWELKKSENLMEQSKEEYNKLLSNYTSEVEKNSQIREQISELKEELSETLDKYHNELKENSLLSQQFECERERNKDFQENYKRLSDCAVQQKCEERTKVLEDLNNSLKLKLENERKTNKEFNKEVIAYQENLTSYNCKIKELEALNEALKIELQNSIKKKELEESSLDFISLPSFDKSGTETKNLRYEKQKLTISRLKEKIDYLETQLINAKSKCNVISNEKEDMQEQWLKLKHEFENFRSNVSTEKNTIKGQYEQIISHYDENIRKLQDKISQFEETCKMHEVELNEKEELQRKFMEGKEINNTVVKNINETLRGVQLENQRLTTQLEEKGSTIMSLAKEIENLGKSKEKFKGQLEELSLKVIGLERDLTLKKEEVYKLENQLREKDVTIKALKTNNSDLDMKLSRSFIEMTEKDNAYKALLETNNLIQERFSKTDDHKEKELMHIEEKIRCSKGELADLEEKILSERKLLQETKRDYDTFLLKISDYTDLIVNCKNELHSAISISTEKWQIELEKDLSYKHLPLLDENVKDVEDQLFCLTETVTATVLLLEILSTRAPALQNDLSIIKGLTSSLTSSATKKPLNKFTLRPARLSIGRPVSPDSPTDIVSSDLGMCGDAGNSHRITDPDSQGDRFGNRNQCQREISNSHLFSPVAFQFDDAFPHLTDSFLEQIGLHEDSTKQTLTDEETERIFTSFAIQITLDSNDIKDRLKTQRSQCEKQHSKCCYLIKDISVRLRHHKYSGTTDMINPILQLLENIKILVKEIVQSSGQLGILSCESRMIRCWNLVTNYMAILKKESDLNSSARKMMKDKEVNTDNRVLVKKASKRDGDNLIREIKGTNSDITNMAGYRCLSFLWCAKKSIIGIIFLIVLCLFGLIALQWQCETNTEQRVCPLDEFIRKKDMGHPPY